ncbi:MAG: ImmA/IrrE family metallo-endopeptidase [Planctomycetes bacterium]|nr:ImmA/IrrE family metallo-endopeptidase [Planctomycetota bacterium]
MKDLYRRLKDVGYERKFVRECVLPDWWSDDLAAVPANRALAELAIARQFGFRAADLRDPKRSLVLPRCENIRLKRSARLTVQQVAGTVVVARRIAELVAECTTDLPTFDGAALAAAVRATILRNHAYVDLASLLKYCWSHGIAVVRLARTPERCKKLAGLATFCGNRPVIVLASGHDSPPWIAFHLAHELGHIMLQHVRNSGDLLVDQDLDKKDEDQQEQEADRFACEVLSGESSPGFTPTFGLTAEKLARAALRYGESRRISPGTVVLIYGRSAKRFPAAQKALDFLGQKVGAHEQITGALRRVLQAGDLPESTERFLSGCAGLTG